MAILVAQIQSITVLRLIEHIVQICLLGSAKKGVFVFHITGYNQSLYPEFEGFIKAFADNSLPRLYALIEKYRAKKQVIIFKSRKEADDFLRQG